MGLYCTFTLGMVRMTSDQHDKKPTYRELWICNWPRSYIGGETFPVLFETKEMGGFHVIDYAALLDAQDEIERLMKYISTKSEMQKQLDDLDKYWPKLCMIDSLEQERDALKAEAKYANDRAIEFGNIITELKAEVESCKEGNQRLRFQILEMNELYNKLREERDALKAEVAELLKERAADWPTYKEYYQEEVTKLKAELKQYEIMPDKMTFDQICAELDAAKAENSRLRGALEDAMKHVVNLEAFTRIKEALEK